LDPTAHIVVLRQIGVLYSCCISPVFAELTKPGSGEKFEPISKNPCLFIINRLFNEINRLFLEFLLEIENFIENRLDISLKFFISTGYFQISTGYLITKPRFSPDIALSYCHLSKIFANKVDEPILVGHLKWRPTFESKMVMKETENCFLHNLESQLWAIG
jgi:hypothetical protein